MIPVLIHYLVRRQSGTAFCKAEPENIIVFPFQLEVWLNISGTKLLQLKQKIAFASKSVCPLLYGCKRWHMQKDLYSHWGGFTHLGVLNRRQNLHRTKLVALFG